MSARRNIRQVAGLIGMGALVALALHQLDRSLRSDIDPYRPAVTVAAAYDAPVLAAIVRPPAVTPERFLARPLFHADRRPYAPPVEAAPVAAPAPAPTRPAPGLRPEELRIVGILISGGRRRAKIVFPESPEGVWVGVNGKLGNLVVKDIAPQSVMLLADGEEVRVEIDLRGAEEPDGID